jgi:hypothetical protein
MASALPTQVARLRIETVELLHPGRQVGLADLHDEVVVLRHEAPAVQTPTAGTSDAPKQLDERQPVSRVEEDGVAVDAVSRHVVDAVRHLMPYRPRHESNVAGIRLL